MRPVSTEVKLLLHFGYGSRSTGHGAGAGTDALWLDDLVAAHPVDPERRLRGGGAGPVTELLCGVFAVDGGRQHPVLAWLPSILHLRGGGGRPPSRNH